MRLTKDDPCACELRALLGQYFLFTRADLRLSQMEFADALSMDKRSYIDIEHRKSLCCSLTLLSLSLLLLQGQRGLPQRLPPHTR